MFVKAERALGIEPRVIEAAQKAAVRVEARALELPPLIDRQLLILLPRERFFDWTNRWSERIKGEALQAGTDTERWSSARAYLIPRLASEKLVLKFIAENQGYFLDSLVCGYSPKHLWPWIPEPSEFEQWFEVRLVNCGPWDLGRGKIHRLPDELAALMREI